MQRRSQRFDFPNGQNETLSGRLELPNFTPKAFAIFAHCFTCGKDVIAASRISRELCRHGIGVLRFDFTGLGNSQGDFANTNFSSNVEDIIHASESLGQQFQLPSLLVGHSLGGAAVIAAASQLPTVKVVAAIGAPSEPSHVFHLLKTVRPDIEARGEAEIRLAGRQFTIKKHFLDDASEVTLKKHLANFNKALVVFHSPLDEVVEIEQARLLYENAKHPKSFVSLDQADHLLTRPADAAFVAKALSAWATRYLEDNVPIEPSVPQGEDGEVVVAETGKNYAVNVQAGVHAWRVDEPESVGGMDTGPTPYDQLLAALGTCKTITVRMYADRKEWPLHRVAAFLKHERIHAKDCETCESDSNSKVDRIRVELDLQGDLDESQRKRLLEIADKCPIHRTLMHEKEIVTRLRTNE